MLLNSSVAYCEKLYIDLSVKFELINKLYKTSTQKIVFHLKCSVYVQDFGNGSVLSDDLDEEPELILDAEPRYASPLTTIDLLPGLEREMAVDEDEDEQERIEMQTDQESFKVRDESLPSYLEKMHSWEEPGLLNPYQFSSQSDTQQQVMSIETPLKYDVIIK